MEQNQTNNQTQSEEENSFIFEEKGTYCKVGSPASGIMEVDLQSFKQRGAEERYISFSTHSLNDDKEFVTSEMFFLDEASFNKFKAFIAKLNWND